MSYIFSDCKLLSSLPNISKWNTQNVTDMINMFDGCKLLSSIPNIKPKIKIIKKGFINKKGSSLFYKERTITLNSSPKFLLEDNLDILLINLEKKW